jgi:hypothetical protein
MTVREAGDDTRAKLAARLGGHGELPLHLVNEFFLCAPARVRREILTRNALSEEEEAPTDDIPQAPDAAALIEAARHTNGAEFARKASAALGIAPCTLTAIVADESAEALAVLCKGAHFDRVAFSTLALLQSGGAGDPVMRLMAYDTVPQRAADRLTHHWRAQAAHLHAEHAHAAE